DRGGAGRGDGAGRPRRGCLCAGAWRAGRRPRLRRERRSWRARGSRRVREDGPRAGGPLPRRLRDGYTRIVRERLRSGRGRYERLAEKGQRPEIMIIGCCGSRVSPEVIFDAAPGEMFVVRNVANLVPPYEPDNVSHHGTSAALEFAVQAL